MRTWPFSTQNKSVQHSNQIKQNLFVLFWSDEQQNSGGFCNTFCYFNRITFFVFERTLSQREQINDANAHRFCGFFMAHKPNHVYYTILFAPLVRIGFTKVQSTLALHRADLEHLLFSVRQIEIQWLRLWMAFVIRTLESLSLSL